jgi:hypothetical protein
MTDIAPPQTLKHRLATLDAQAAAYAAKVAQTPEKRGETSVSEALGGLIKVRTCMDCGASFEGILGLCGECADRRWNLEQDRKKAKANTVRNADWLAICPRIYRDTDWSRRELSPEIVKLASAWKIGSPKHSLALHGPTGKGKTRAAFAILHRYHAAGWTVYAMHAGDAWDNGKRVQGLSSAARLQYADEQEVGEAAVAALRRARDCDILLLDDVGKERAGANGILSEAVSEAFFGLIEFRLANVLPTIWTCNMSAAALMQRFGPDRGQPLMRRLNEVSETPML